VPLMLFVGICIVEMLLGGHPLLIGGRRRRWHVMRRVAVHAF